MNKQERAENSNWTEEELILALNLYLKNGTLSTANSEVIKLSNFLRKANFPKLTNLPQKFRSPSSVNLKLSNFAAIDPNHSGKGMEGFSKKDENVWIKYACDETLVDELAKEITQGRNITSLKPHRYCEEIHIESVNIFNFNLQNDSKTTFVNKSEALLVAQYVHYLKTLEKIYCRHLYTIGPIRAFCDLFNKTDNILIEAKGDTNRNSIRMAIGQLLDYSRFHTLKPKLAILLPRKPADDMLELLESLEIETIFKTKSGWEHYSKKQGHN